MGAEEWAVVILVVGTRLFIFLFTVITVLFDRYRTVFTARGVMATRAGETA